MDYVFISHVAQDGNAALELALLLEGRGYATWTYELDTVPAVSYLVQTGRAIEACRVFLLLASRKALGSLQLPNEIVQAHEAGKKFMPVLLDLSDAVLKSEAFEWRMAIGAATSIPYDPDDLSALGRQLVLGLDLLEVARRAEPDRARIEVIRKALRTRQQQSRKDATPSEPIPERPQRQDIGVERPPTTIRWQMILLAILLVAGLGGGVGWWQTRDQGNVVVGVMDIKHHGKVSESMAEFTRDGLNSVLGNLGKVPVFSKQKIDFIRTKRGLSEIEVAEALGITRMISGTLSSAGTKLVLQVEVIDIAHDGILLATAQVRGTEDQLLVMQNDAAFAILDRLKVRVTDEERQQVIATRSNDLQDYYQLLANTMGTAAPTQASGEGQPGDPSPYRIPPGTWNLLGPREARAADSPDELAVRALLDRYQTELEHKNLDGLGTVYVSLTDGMRSALAQYFQNANDLKVEFSNYDILVEGDEALATFTRVDTFEDAQSGRDVRLKVQMNTVVARYDDGWRIKLVQR